MNSKKLFGIALAAMILLPAMPAQAALSEKVCKQAWAIGKVVGGLAIAAVAGCVMLYSEYNARAQINGLMKNPSAESSPSMTNKDHAGLVRTITSWYHGGLGLFVAGGLTLAGFGIKALLKK